MKCVKNVRDIGWEKTKYEKEENGNINKCKSVRWNIKILEKEIS